ncbi:carboxymuconolactone decarboxylase family protein [Streptomyces sp. N2-109]|uniref:Carboxymuconolactone decarboxylase family protein n=1 Tax=Streptomyces gossypii TaxID=2883101 RepID=A0ABT2JZF4_9ACTN|nr:carboxymuconolactone decarboxylase family protein [Streptomyces gossypii]MCT2593081.1 carboxymuconolactone decarboxylase family protein [Streptomyces gossypii]
MQARMGNPAQVVPGAMDALLALGTSTENTGVPAVTLYLAHLRTSQINSCSVCVRVHAAELKKAGESDERIFAVSTWRERPFFNDAERAALALAEAVTRVNDRPDAVPDATWDEAARHYDEMQLGGLLLSIATVNMWNRVNLATRQVADIDWK